LSAVYRSRLYPRSVLCQMGSSSAFRGLPGFFIE
jgi:hypothetical protein